MSCKEAKPNEAVAAFGVEFIMFAYTKFSLNGCLVKKRVTESNVLIVWNRISSLTELGSTKPE